MIVVYTSPGCASCRKVKQWLKDRNLPFTEKNIFKTLLDEEEIRYLLMRSENGTDDLDHIITRKYSEEERLSLLPSVVVHRIQRQYVSGPRCERVYKSIYKEACQHMSWHGKISFLSSVISIL